MTKHNVITYIILTVSLLCNVCLELELRKLKTEDIANIQIQLDLLSDRVSNNEEDIERIDNKPNTNLSNDLRIRELEQRLDNHTSFGGL